MQRVATLWNYVRFLPWQPEAETERLQTDRALLIVFWVALVGDDRKRRHADG